MASLHDNRISRVSPRKKQMFVSVAVCAKKPNHPRSVNIGMREKHPRTRKRCSVLAGKPFSSYWGPSPSRPPASHRDPKNPKKQKGSQWVCLRRRLPAPSVQKLSRNDLAVIHDRYENVLGQMNRHKCSMQNAYRLAGLSRSTVRDFIAIAELKKVDEDCYTHTQKGQPRERNKHPGDRDGMPRDTEGLQG